MATRRLNIVGNRYSRLLVLKETRKSQSCRNYYYECLCDCGNTTEVRSNSLRGGRTVSCGCYGREIASKVCKKRNTVHGLNTHPLYKVWSDMKQRCYNIRNVGYKDYGGRGIHVCEAWRNSFLNFYADMVDNYKEGLFLDRVDNDGSYSSDNCRWVTRSQNSVNTRKRAGSISKYRGVTLRPNGKWQAMVYKGGENYYLGVFVEEEDAARAYDARATELYDEFVNLNFPDNKQRGSKKS